MKMLIGYICFGVLSMVMCSLYLSWIKCDLSMTTAGNCDFEQISNAIDEYLEKDEKTPQLALWYKQAITEWYYCESSRILRYTIVLFSYIFGVVSQVFFKQNRITIPYFQVNFVCFFFFFFST